MRCIKCKDTACIEIRRHNSGFCRDHFLEYFENQVKKAIHDWDMLSHDDRILVAVSGGKDSLALWDVLLRQGYQADGLYIGLGIDEYSDVSGDKARKFAEQRNAHLEWVDIEEEYGSGIKGLAKQARRHTCSACGTTKRYQFNRIAREKGYTVLATGHNLDDEAAALFGNVLHWQTGYLSRQSPVLPASPSGLVKKVKPLYRVGERETASYAVLRGIDYIFEECPLAVGNQSLKYKEALNLLEQTSPGTKHNFLFNFLERTHTLFQPDDAELRECLECGAPTSSDICAFCRITQQARNRPQDFIGLTPVPVEGD
jgi:uncharacterized protein (TIGR00269 family)